jgi:predicted nucleotide-binding protein
MGMIDPSAKRCATIRAIEETVVAWVEEPTFTEIANRHPSMWRRLSVDLSKRLRERGELVRPSHEKPVVFIGSTVERLPLARAIQAACQYDPWITRLWTDGVFHAGETTIESLARQLDSPDFGLLVVTADDISETRGVLSPTPRDNVIFELGLLMGALGRERTFMVRLREERDLKLPSDLLGVKALEVTPGSEDDLPSRVAPAVNELRAIVSRLRCR